MSSSKSSPLKIAVFNEFVYFDRIPVKYHEFVDRGKIPLASSVEEHSILSSNIKIFVPKDTVLIDKDLIEGIKSDFINAGFKINNVNNVNNLTDRLIFYYPYYPLTDYYLAARLNV